jgi:hypothetical protein
MSLWLASFFDWCGTTERLTDIHIYFGTPFWGAMKLSLAICPHGMKILLFWILYLKRILHLWWKTFANGGVLFPRRLDFGTCSC